MTRLEDTLGALLDRAAPTGAGVGFDDVARRVRRRRRVSTAAVAAAAAVGVAVVAGSVLANGGGRATSVSEPTRVPVLRGARSVDFRGITFAVPSGWKVAPAACGQPPEHTVVIGVTGASCPGQPAGVPVTTAVTLTDLYGPQYDLVQAGRRTTWQGQPAWTATETSHGRTTTTLALPWLNAVVTAQSSDPATARTLIDAVAVHPGTGLEVPPVPVRGTAGAGPTVFLQSLTGHDGDGQQRNITITALDDVTRILTDLRALPLLTTEPAACTGVTPRTALITVHSGSATRTYAAQFDTCGTVLGGTGVAAAVSPQLLADVKRLLPNSGL